MKISGDAGHNCYPDGGAVGYKIEDNLTKEVWNLVQEKFRALGYTVVDCTPWNSRFNSVNGSLGYRVRLANESGSELHLCIHFNAGGGTGVECWVIPGGKAEEYAKQICEEISRELNIPNRGVKDGSRLYVPKYTNMSCILIECGFVDSQNDMSKYNANKIASAIVKAVTGQEVSERKRKYIVTDYLPFGYRGDGSFNSVDLEYILSYFGGIRCYMKSNERGMWIETQYLTDEQIESLKSQLGSWFYEVREE